VPEVPGSILRSGKDVYAFFYVLLFCVFYFLVQKNIIWNAMLPYPLQCFFCCYFLLNILQTIRVSRYRHCIFKTVSTCRCATKQGNNILRAWCKTIVTTLFYITSYNSFAFQNNQAVTFYLNQSQRSE